METRILHQDRLLTFVDALIRDHEVIAPRDERFFGRIDVAQEMDLRDEKPAMSLKDLFFPQREVLVSYETGTSGVTLAEPASQADAVRVIFAARPCDAAAFPILDKLFSWDTIDASYVRQRQQTAIVTVACDQPCSTCFCVSLDGSPAGIEGSDLLLTLLDDVYHVQIITERGRALVEPNQAMFGESNGEFDRARARVEDECCTRMAKSVTVNGLDKTLDFDSPAWETLTQQCIDCGVCTFLCPTCHCFDIQDEGGPDRGERVRLWDACVFYDYTKAHAGQPRPTHYRRYRQRIMHKFRYYPENFGSTLCVGCGRCIQYCPAGIDLRDVLHALQD